MCLPNTRPNLFTDKLAHCVCMLSNQKKEKANKLD